MANKKALSIGVYTFLSYFACYTARNIISAIMPQMAERNIYTLESLGIMGSAFFFAYGCGQLVNGMIGNYVPAKYMVAAGLSLSGALIIIFPFCRAVPPAILLWGACGFLGSMLWAPITRLVGENTETGTGRLILTALSFASNVGMAAAYGFAIISATTNNWKTGFYISGCMIIIIAAAWYAGISRMEKQGMLSAGEKAGVGSGPGVPDAPRGVGADTDAPLGVGAVTSAPQRVVAAKPVFFRHVTPGFIFMAGVTGLNGIIRNGVNFWVPVFLTDILSSGDVKIVSSLAAAVPFVNMAGVVASVYMLKRISGKGGDGKLCAYLSSVSSVMFCVLLLTNDSFPIISIAALFIASACMSGVTNTVFCIFVLRFVSTGNISGISGSLDFISYVSGAAASFVFGMALSSGWAAIISIWLAAALLSVMLSYLTNNYYRNEVRVR